MNRQCESLTITIEKGILKESYNNYYEFFNNSFWYKDCQLIRTLLELIHKQMSTYKDFSTRK